MRLLRHGPPGAERPGVLDKDGRNRDLSGPVTDLACEFLPPTPLGRPPGLNVSELSLVDGDPRVGPGVGRVAKLICTGLNS